MTTGMMERAVPMTGARVTATSFPRRSKGATGFSLIELMIVVAVVAILAAVAYPAYNDQVRKSRRAQAKADLVELAQILERRHTVNNSYGGTMPFTASPSEPGATPRYNITPANLGAGAQAFTLTATPIGDQVNDSCGTLTLSNTGQKGNSTGAFADCW